MKTQTAWNLLLKTLGLILFFKFLLTAQEYFVFYQRLSRSPNADSAYFVSLWFATLLLYIVCIYFLLFKSDTIQGLLKLNKGMEDEQIEINIQGSSILKLASIVLGGLLIIESIPLFVNNLRAFLDERSSMLYRNSGSIMFSDLILVVIGCFLVFKSGAISKFFQSEEA